MSYLWPTGFTGGSTYSYRLESNPPDPEDDELDEDVKNDPVEEDDAETAPEPPVEEDAG